MKIFRIIIEMRLNGTDTILRAEHAMDMDMLRKEGEIEGGRHVLRLANAIYDKMEKELELLNIPRDANEPSTGNQV